MMPLQGRTRRWLLLLTVLTAAAACRDSLSPRQVGVPTDGSKLIVDGAHNGGNQNVFFLPPMVASPVGQPGYGGPFQPGLPVEIKLVCTTAVSGSSCPNFDFPPSVVKEDDTDGQYMVNWDTRSPGADPGDIYRAEVFVGSTQVAYADIALVSNGNPKNVATQGDIILPDGRTLPIKVRIQQGWNCQNQSSCVTQVVLASATTPTLVTTNDGRAAALFPPGTLPQGVSQVLVTIEDVTPDLTTGETCENPSGQQQLTSMVVSPQCFKFTTDPKITFQKAVTVATCVDVVPDRPTTDPLYHTEQLIKYDVGERTTFLRNVAPPITCPPEAPTTIGSRSNSLLNNALAALSRAGRAVGNIFTPKSAYAFHLGVGGLIDSSGAFSYITAGFPITESISSGDGQTGVTGMPLPQPFKVLITSAHFSTVPVPNESVRCDVGAGGGSFGKLGTSVTVTTGADGIATCPILTLGSTGANTVTATALNIDNGVIAAEGTLPDTSSVTLHGAVTFTAQAVQTLTLVDCELPSPLGGDEISRGFYIPNFPGSGFSQVNLQFSADVAGSYTVQLTAHSGTYDGPTLGSSQATVSLAPGQFTSGSFFFPSPSVAGGSTVAFAMNVVSQPEGAQRTFFGVANTFAGVPSCPVIETEDTTAPLSTFRRQGVAIQVIQSAPVEIQ
jgi:hypothetical protein